MVKAIIKEIELRCSYLGQEEVNTIYFGGGTPSLLTKSEIQSIIKKIQDEFNVSLQPEITLEANPEDITSNYLNDITSLGINRISLGVQSFNEENLKLMNRAHNAAQSVESIKLIKASEINNFTVDFIYAIPSKNHDTWKKDLELLMKMDIPHVSCYSLTIEEKTVFGKWQKKGDFIAASEDFDTEQYEMLIETMFTNGYEQYEISNFCKNGYRSKHNSNYWNQVKYLGVGPGAHSFDGNSRQANYKNNGLYLKAINDNVIAGEIEILDSKTKINEWILTKLRTYDGLDLEQLILTLNYDLLVEQSEVIYKLIEQNAMILENNVLKLTKKGKLVADWIAGELFLD
jgi:oxygen-independent coproporphyrinogen-3 oxidase